MPSIIIALVYLVLVASPSYAGSGAEKMSDSNKALSNSTVEKIEMPSDSAAPQGGSGDQSNSAIKTTSKFKEKSWRRGDAPFGRRSGSGSEEAAPKK